MMVRINDALISRPISVIIAPCPAASTCGVMIAMPPTHRPPIAVLIQIGSGHRLNRHSTAPPKTITAIPSTPVSSASNNSGRYCSGRMALTGGTSIM